jgi:hypothetical protein
MSEFLRGMAGPFVAVWGMVGPYRMGWAVSTMLMIGAGWLLWGWWFRDSQKNLPPEE